jgi:hypothetical protein
MDASILQMKWKEKTQNKKHLRNPILATVDGRICGTTTVKATVNV